MIQYLDSVLVACMLIAGALAGYLVARKINEASYGIFVEQAKAKAKAIEFEAKNVLKDANIKVSEAELAAKKVYEDKSAQLQKEYNTKFNEIQRQEGIIKSELDLIQSQKSDLEKQKFQAQSLYDEGVNLKNIYQEKMQEALKTLERQAGLTQDEAKAIVLARVEENSRADIAHIVRRYEEETKKEIKKRVNFILAQATSRFAGEFAAERLINVVNIKNDELKGRIIGKEGRNIKTLEMVLGVEVIIDDTPNAIVLSSFNLYRRAIATRVVELLVEDGRIQPARIEEIYKKVSQEFEENILEEGENILMDLGISNMHPEIIKLIGKLRFRASYGQNALAHSLEVAHLASIIAAETGGDEKLAKRAGILHDIGKALTHEHEGSHVDLGAEICKRYKEHPAVINAIYAHHGHVEADCVESAAVCAADVLSAARPGARREVLEAFLKRVQEIENIATSKEGIKAAYAINAGREIRVIANASLVNDDEAVLIAKEIANEIRERVQFPGEIKVNVIRELRAIEIARK